MKSKYSSIFLDWLNLEMKANEGKDETLQVLDKVIECTESFRISGTELKEMVEYTCHPYLNISLLKQ